MIPAVHPCRVLELATLLELLRFYAEKFMIITQRMLTLMRAFPEDDIPIPPDIMKVHDQQGGLRTNIAYVNAACKEIGIDISGQVNRTMNIVNVGTPTYRDVHKSLEFLLQTVHDELQKSVFLRIPSGAESYYQNTELFGAKVAKVFKSARRDIHDAGKCFATGGYTATVFHLMRVMEIGVQRLGKKLGVPDATDKEWQKIINDMNSAIRFRYSGISGKLTKEQKAERDKYAQAVALLENVKNAWRNKTMHPKASYDDREAKKVLLAAEAYMQELAKIM